MGLLPGYGFIDFCWSGSPNKTRQAPPPGDVPNLIRWRCFVPVALR
nr:hypothetical protein [Klebsiella sp.]